MLTGPLPVLGTAWVWARQAGLVPQHQNHPLFSSYVEALFGEASVYGSWVFASGHDASLQWVTKGQQVQLVSGTSARAGEPVVGPVAGDFAAASPGWVELVLDATGGSVVQVQATDFSAFTHALPRVASQRGIRLLEVHPADESLESVFSYLVAR